MTITKHDKMLKVGKDFVDAVSGKIACLGECEIDNAKRFSWCSTFPIAQTEHALREAAKSEGKRVTLFISQAR